MAFRLQVNTGACIAVIMKHTIKLEVDFKSSFFIMTIGQLANETGVPASTIRYWERIGVLPQPARSGGQRRYLPETVHQLAVLRLAQSCGFRLTEMRTLLRGFDSGVAPPRRWQELAHKKRAELDEQMARVRAMRRMVDRVLRCQCADLGQCGRMAAAALGS